MYHGVLNTHTHNNSRQSAGVAHGGPVYDITALLVLRKRKLMKDPDVSIGVRPLMTD